MLHGGTSVCIIIMVLILHTYPVGAKLLVERGRQHKALMPSRGSGADIKVPLDFLSGKNQTISRRDLDAIINENSLINLVQTIVRKEMQDCVLVLVADLTFWNSRLLDHLITLTNPKQVIQTGKTHTMTIGKWNISQCRGHIYLLSDPQPLISAANLTDKDSYWDYEGKYVVVGLDINMLQVFLQTKKAMKTENLVAILKSKHLGEYSIYINKLYGGRGMARVTSWRNDSSSLLVDIFPDKISNLQKADINVVLFHFPPSIIYRRSANGTLLYRFGTDIEIINTLAQVFNFTIQIREPPPGEMWGIKAEDGTFNGMVGMVGRGEGDLAVANLYITDNGKRREFMEFSSPYRKEESCFLARVEPSLPRWQSLGLPFQLFLWLAVLGGLIISGLVLFCLAQASKTSGGESLAFQSVSFSSLYTIGVHFRQSQARMPHRISTQVFMAFLWIYVIILTVGYSCNLTAFLTIVRRPSGVETFEELDESGIKVISFSDFFKASMVLSANKYIQSIAKRSTILPNFDDIMTEVLAGRGVMLQSQGYMEYASSKLTTASGMPRVRIMKECFLPFTIGIAYQRNSPLKEKFDRAISRIFEAGLARHWFLESLARDRKYKSQEKQGDRSIGETSDANTDTISLGIDHVQGIFLTCVIGYIVSAITFLVEILSPSQ